MFGFKDGQGVKIGQAITAAAAAVLLLAGCAGGGEAETADVEADATTATDTSPDAAAPEDATDDAATSEAGGDVTDEVCEEVGAAIFSFLEASFAAIDTEVTSGEVTSKLDEAVAELQAAPDPGGEKWDEFVELAEGYADAWRDAPADSLAFEQYEAVNAEWEELAESLEVDQDVEDLTPFVGEKCNDMIQEAFIEETP